MSAKPNVQESLIVPVMQPSGTLEEQRRRRAEALRAATGMWKSRTDIPNHGVEYQEEIRNEWR
ncbi:MULTISPECIES: hypothetical protein [unclassified Janthinobacterium]|uniref:hypothetical protein n=1 Tax=unclassified Janthinobacterium TaxID=2610881 RepID=UPI001612321F|nr:MULTISPECIES: hypothetical protein [unclassified Janthinobacterium]MBB5606230.1 hypothetical protein [Janthinobacterium sp. S3T4]MBB5611898.1 hypothetical protein [Janthinobacterium sp. S3M3]